MRSICTLTHTGERYIISMCVPVDGSLHSSPGSPETIVDFRALPQKCSSKIDRHFPHRVHVEIAVGSNVACCCRTRTPENHRQDLRQLAERLGQTLYDIARIRGLNVLIHVGHVYPSPARNWIRVPEDEV